MNLQKLSKSSLIHSGIAGFFNTTQWISKQIGPRLARRRPVRIHRNMQISAWDQHPVFFDVYTPVGPQPEQGWPVALMIHGGGWRFFSKDSHALVAATIAEMGYVTVAMDYRLAPQHPFPAGLVDVLSVYDWIHQNPSQLGVNLDQIAITGESAGASFGLAIGMMASGLATLADLEDPRFLGRTLNWKTPKKMMIHCGYYHVSDVTRYDGKLSTLVAERIRMIRKNYLPQSLQGPSKPFWGLADPVVILETRAKSQLDLAKNFPEVFIPVGDRDPVLDDSLRLERALQALGVRAQAKVYGRAPHSFYAMPWHSQYKNCWDDIRVFLKGQT